jgi:hypothetical protein
MNNMQTKYAILLIIVAGLLSFTACNDDFLDRVPEVSVSDGAVWKTPDHLKLYVNNLYNQDALLPLYNGYSNDALPFSVDANNGSDTYIPIDYSTYMNSQTTLPESGGGWASGDWSLLRNINYFFANYKNAVGDEVVINRYVGEALFFRAIFYFNKVKRFGNVPWYETLLTMADEDLLLKGRDPRNTVIQNLMNDLDKAVGYLPLKSEAAGRINKETAMLLQARIALYEGTWEKYHALAGTPFAVTGSDGAAFISKAKEVTDALIALNVCGLDNVGTANGYAILFNRPSYSSSKEVMLWRQYQLSIITHYWPRYTWNGAGAGLSKRMIDYYLDKDGKPAELSALALGDATVLDLVTNRDPRLNQTIWVNDGAHVVDAATGELFLKPLLGATGTTYTSTGYPLYKGHDPSQYASTQGTTGAIYFRYAEALLINAEAKAELGSISQTDLDNTVNKLRERVGMARMVLSDVNSWSGAYKKQFPALSNIINEIRRERTVELVAEGFRVDDIFRWAAADILIKGYRPQGAKAAQWSEVPVPVDADGYLLPYATTLAGGYNFDSGRDYLYPLPITEMVLNPNLKPNNPGWGTGD